MTVTAKYPGDTVRELKLRRGAECGSIAIEQYDKHLRVCSFLPGDIAEYQVEEIFLTTTSPERRMFYCNRADADAMFDTFVQDAYAAGWSPENQ